MGQDLKDQRPKNLYFKNRAAKFLLSLLVSVLTNINFSDIETGYKLIKTSN